MSSELHHTLKSTYIFPIFAGKVVIRKHARYFSRTVTLREELVVVRRDMTCGKHDVSTIVAETVINLA